MVLFQMGDCRFCGTSEGVKINIFDSACDHVSKIEMILPLQMVASESMPKVMCHRCMHKINEFYDFRRKCLSLDLKWRARLITLESNSTSAEVLPVTIKLEPPDPDSPVEISSENASSAANCGWSYTPESELLNHAAAVTTTDKQDKQKRAVDAISIEEDKSKCGDPGKAVPENNTANKDATSSLAKRGKKPNRKTTTFSPPKDLKRKKTEKKNDTKDEIKNDSKKSVLRAAVKSAALPENTSVTTSNIKTPLQVTPNLEAQKLPPSRTPLPEKTTKIAKVQKLKPNVTEGVSLSPQSSSKEPPNLTVSQVKAYPEKQTTTVSSKISPRNNQKVTSLELPKPPTDSEKPLPSHIIMTSIPNVCTIYTCSLCERTFTSRSLACCHNDCVKMKNSSKAETDESESTEGIYACSHCDMKFTRHASLVPHEETHIVNEIAEDSDTLSSSSDEETSRKRKKKTSRSSPMEIDSLKSIPSAFS